MQIQFASFETEQDAWEYMYNKLADEDCIDNERLAYQDDAEGMSKYDQQAEEGCCGSYDENIVIGGRAATIGCNYGH